MSGESPWYKCYPSNFLRGCFGLTAEEIGVYRTIVDLIYDKGGPIDDSPADIARISGCSTRKFSIIRDKLLTMPEKLVRTPSGKLMNPRAGVEIRKRQKSDGTIIDPIIDPIKKVTSAENKDLGVSFSNGSREQNGGHFDGNISKKTGDNRPDNRGDKIDPIEHNQSLNSEKPDSRRARARESRVQIESTTAPTLESVMSKAERFCREVGLSLTSDPKHARFIDDLNKLEDQGVDFDLDLLPVIKERIASGRMPQTVTPNYFAKPAIARAQARKANALKSAAQPFEDTNADGWRGRLRSWITCGHWPVGKYGPRPTDPACRAPADMVQNAVVIWKAQGSHPREWFCELGSCFKPWDRVVVFRDEPDADRGT